MQGFQGNWTAELLAVAEEILTWKHIPSPFLPDQGVKDRLKYYLQVFYLTGYQDRQKREAWKESRDCYFYYQH